MIGLATRPLITFLDEGDGRQPPVVAPIAASGITFLGGAPGNGKTLLGAEVAITKASGVSRLGFAAEPGRVLFVSADMGPDATRDYLQMLMYPGRELALQNLFIATPHGLLLDEPDGAEAFFGAVRDVAPELIVMDYFANFIGTDGFSNAELRPVLDVFAEMRDVMKISLFVLDQTRKGTGQSGADGPAVDALYGGRAKGAIADLVIFTKKDAGSGVFTVKGAKARSAGFADINLTFDGVNGWQRQGVSSFRPTPAEDSVLAEIAAAANSRGRTIAELQSLCALSERAVRAAIATLTYHGKIFEGPKVGRSKTYRDARVQEGASQGALQDALKGASAPPPYKGARSPAGLQSSDEEPASDADVARRFGPEAVSSNALREYASMQPRGIDGGAA